MKTAEAIWQAKQKCPDLVVVPPDYAAYKRYSRLARMIYYGYTDLVEPFGLMSRGSTSPDRYSCSGATPCSWRGRYRSA